MHKLPLFFLLLLSINTSAQFQAANWFFGTHAGLTFNTNPPTPLTGGQINQTEGCSSISDSAGNLLFYSDGLTVWDNTHTVMPNGTGLLGGVSSTQSSVVVQDPGNASKFYLFTVPQQNYPFPLSYSIIDMTLNNGLGDVTSTKNIPLMSNSTEKLTAVFHSNGTDVWIIGHEFGNNNFNAFLLTATGLSLTPVISSTGSTHSAFSPNNVIGYMKASPCGDKLAVAVWYADYLELFDFDNSTGVISHPVLLGSWSASSGVYGVEFSPDDSKLYASIITPGIVIQYDLLAGSDSAIIASADTIGTSAVNFNGALQTGPDARIYLVKYNSGTLDCITKPNEKGVACGYIENFLSLGLGIGQLGLPDFFSSYFCNIIGISPVEDENLFSIFPNPVHDEIHIKLNVEEPGKNVALRIFNCLGQCVYSSELSFAGSGTDIKLSLEGWSRGVYFLNITAAKKSFAEKFIRL